MPRGVPLNEGEVHQRLVRLANLERLHEAAKARITRLEEENHALRTELAAQRVLNEKLLLRVEELERMVFGRRRHHPEDLPPAPPPPPEEQADPAPRPPSSYRRPLPKPEEITREEHLPVDTCRHCGGVLSSREEHIRYVEDLDLELLKQAKRVTKLTIERGYCPSCGQWSAGRDLRGHPVELGENVRNLVCFLVTILDQTYAQVRTFLEGLCGFRVTDGEIAALVQEQGVQWRPAYEKLKARIRDGPGVHLDETGWPIQEDRWRTFAWVMSRSDTPDTIYHLADSRGKGNAVELLGESFRGVRITDGYSAYQRLSGDHQLCWAHLLRGGRELAEHASVLGAERAAHCRAWSSRLHGVYALLERCRAERFQARRRQRQAAWLLGQVRALSASHPADPKKLSDLKSRLRAYEHALFLCLTHEGIPPTNNRAERDLRKLVLKRKKSFGSKTERGAKALEVILSVCFSLWNRNPKQFFPALAKLTA